VAWRRQFDGVLAGTGVIQQRLLRRQGHALACPTLGQVAGGFGQSFGVVAVHGRSEGCIDGMSTEVLAGNGDVR
jgi:hypothetical protein